MIERLADSRLLPVAEKVLAGERLAFEDGLTLYESDDLPGLGLLANVVRERKNGDLAYFIVNRHINYTNICVNRCRFCAFSRSPGEEGAYLLSVEQCLEKAAGFHDGRVSEFHIVGGLHPELRLDYGERLLRGLKERFPRVHLQAFTAVEIAHFARQDGIPVEDCLRRLKAAGLGSLPGGGAELFSPRVRSLLCPKKLSPDGWLEVMRAAHRLGLRSNATLLYGHIETPDEIVSHLLRLRELQDETGGFLAFIPLAFHPEHTALESETEPTTACDDLRALAVARLMLDNFPHIKAFWIMLGLKLAQVALSFGADDVDGTVVEERITHAAGAQTPEGVSAAELVALIREAGRQPVERDTLYEILGRPT
jgi:aminodeoxyfutalosine synthase